MGRCQTRSSVLVPQEDQSMRYAQTGGEDEVEHVHSRAHHSGSGGH